MTAIAGSLTAIAVGSLILSLVATRLILAWLRARAILDRPNPRSSHGTPTPRGGGIGLLVGLLAGWVAVILLLPGGGGAANWLVIAGMLGLAAISFWDDLQGLPAALRLVVQAAAITLVLAELPADLLVFQDILPLGLDRLLSGIAWLWFVNLFNFMDGIDGISGVEAISIGLGTALVAWFAGSLAEVGMGLSLAAAAAGFLVWNWHPARVFLGDVGSVPLGFGIGWLLIALAGDGAWAAALILPAYYLADATLTLLRRMARGERFWEPHRSHFYQRAVIRGASHATVARQVLATNLVLIALALLAVTTAPWAALALAILPVAGRLRGFAAGALGDPDNTASAKPVVRDR